PAELLQADRLATRGCLQRLVDGGLLLGSGRLVILWGVVKQLCESVGALIEQPQRRSGLFLSQVLHALTELFLSGHRRRMVGAGACGATSDWNTPLTSSASLAPGA